MIRDGIRKAFGLYGVMSCAVAERAREIGIRVALGMGAVIGLVGAAWGTKLIESQLHGVTRLDPTAFIAGGGVLIATALLACLVPARRALAVDPMTAIRAE